MISQTTFCLTLPYLSRELLEGVDVVLVQFLVPTLHVSTGLNVYRSLQNGPEIVHKSREAFKGPLPRADLYTSLNLITFHTKRW